MNLGARSWVFGVRTITWLVLIGFQWYLAYMSFGSRSLMGITASYLIKYGHNGRSCDLGIFGILKSIFKLKPSNLVWFSAIFMHFLIDSTACPWLCGFSEWVKQCTQSPSGTSFAIGSWSEGACIRNRLCQLLPYGTDLILPLRSLATILLFQDQQAWTPAWFATTFWRSWSSRHMSSAKDILESVSALLAFITSHLSSWNLNLTITGRILLSPAPPKVEWGCTGFTPMSVCPSVWRQLGFRNFLKKLLAQFISYLSFNPYGVSLLTPIHFRVPSLIFGPLVAKYLAENGVSGTFWKNYWPNSLHSWHLPLWGESLDPYTFSFSLLDISGWGG